MVIGTHTVIHIHIFDSLPFNPSECMIEDLRLNNLGLVFDTKLLQSWENYLWIRTIMIFRAFEPSRWICPSFWLPVYSIANWASLILRDSRVLFIRCFDIFKRQLLNANEGTETYKCCHSWRRHSKPTNTTHKRFEMWNWTELHPQRPTWRWISMKRHKSIVDNCTKRKLKCD